LFRVEGVFVFSPHIALAMYVFSVWLYLRFISLYLESLGANPQDIGFVYNINAIILAMAFILGGVVADRFNRVKVLYVLNSYIIDYSSSPLYSGSSLVNGTDTTSYIQLYQHLDETPCKCSHS